MASTPYSTSSILNRAINPTINNSTFIQKSDHTGIAAFDKLEKAASPSAFHSFVGRPQPGKCYPNTRVNLLKGLEKWAHGMEPVEGTTNSDLDTDPEAKTVTDLDIDSGDEAELDHDTDSRKETYPNIDIYTPVILDNLPIIWLKGGAGAGKSAVAQTFAEQCEDLRHIVASFFFFSTDPTRNHANCLVATLAYQIALADGRIRADIEVVIQHDPHIFDKDFAKQFTSLIINPIQKFMQGENQRPCTIIIDGLDECTGAEVQSAIVLAISGVLPTARTKLPRFLICSRPEEPIMRVFRSVSLAGIHTSIDLSRDHHADDDIETFLKGKFAEIKQTHPHADRIPEDWLSWDDLWTLRCNSSGHFIYADTVMKFISTDARPVIALESILGLRASPQRVREPFAELDVLYHHILSRALEQIDIDTIRLAFGFLGMEKSPASNYHSTVLEGFLDLPDGDLDILLNVTSSLVSVQWSEPYDRIKFCHKSFNDFLHDKHRAERFYIDDDAVYMHAAARCHAMIADTATLDEEMLNLMAQFATRCSRGYDYLDGKQCHSFEGMTRRLQVSEFLHSQAIDNVVHPEWVVCCLEYYCSLLNTFRNNQENGNLLQEAQEDMAVIMLDFCQSEPLKTGQLLLLLCQPARFIKYASPSSERNPVSDIVLFVGELFDSFTGSSIRRQSHDDIFLVKELLEGDIMGDHGLTAEKYTEACLYWAIKLIKQAVYFPSQPRHMLQNQRWIVMREPARRLRAPFQWRKAKQSIRPYYNKGRLGFLNSQQQFQFGWNTILEPAFTNRQLFFGSRPILVRQVRKQCNSTVDKHELYVRRECGLRIVKYKKAITWQDQRTTVRRYRRLDRQAIRACAFPIIPFSSFKLLGDDPRGEQGFYVLPLRTREFSKVHGDYSNSQGKEQRRRKEFALVLACIPDMLAKASRSDDLAALRFKAFPLFAKRFPRLMRQARQAMEEYAIRHGYPAIDGTFGPPMRHPANIQRNVVQVTNPVIPSKTCFFIVQVWVKYLCLQLGALFGGLDEVYTLR